MYVVYFNSRKKQDATAHLRVAYHLNAGDANPGWYRMRVPYEKRPGGAVAVKATKLFFNKPGEVEYYT